MSRIPVHPMTLGRNDVQDVEMFSGFYPLGCLMAYAKVHRDGALQGSFDFRPVTPHGPSQIPALVDELADGGGVFLLSSYVWNHDINIEFAKKLKERSPGALVAIGGPHIPRSPASCQEFFRDNPWIDVAARHEGEDTLAEVLERVAQSGADPSEVSRVDLEGVRGITFRRGDDVVRNADRERTRDLGLYPSPYLTGEYDHWIPGRGAVILETNRGCPYGCTYCDWGAATLSKLYKMSDERVFGEIEFAGKNGIGFIGFCDANFGILPRDLEIARHIAATKERYGFPKEIGYTNAKSTKSHLNQVIKTLRDAGLISVAQISMQTTSDTVLENVKRSNIKTSEYRKMIAFFHSEGIPVASDMMLGLPGQNFETCKDDLQFFFDHKVVAVLFATSVMPNAPMADPAYREQFKIEVDEENMVKSTYSFSHEEYVRMFDLCLAYKLFVKLGVLKYVLYYAQLEHGIPALDFIARWVTRVPEAPHLYPISHRIKEELMGRGYTGMRKDWLLLNWDDAQAQFLFDAIPEFQEEVLAFFEREMGTRPTGPALSSVLLANRAVLPRKGQPLPDEIPLERDVVAYFSDLRRLANVNELPENHVPLESRGPGLLRISAQPPTMSYGYFDFSMTAGELERKSNLSI